MTSWSADMQIAAWNKQMANIPQALKDAAEGANTKSQDEFVKKLHRAAPLGPAPDHIRNTIQKRDGDASKLEKIVSIGSAALYYIIPLEFGHKDKKSGKIVPGVRFFRSVRTIMRKKHRNRMRTAVRRALKKLFP